MVAPNQQRASGKTAAQETAADATKEGDQLLDTPIDDRRRFRSPGFHRMRVEWKEEDAIILARAKQMAEKRLIAEFPDAYQVLNGIYDLVREPQMDGDRVVRDDHGFVVWARDRYGNYNEDWEKLTRSEKDNILFTITTRLVDWENRSQLLWGEAMMAKGMWEERYSIAFDAPMAGTVGDREAAGRKDAAEERYFAIYLTLLSRMAESLVHSMDRIAQRLRDSLYGGGYR